MNIKLARADVGEYIRRLAKENKTPEETALAKSPFEGISPSELAGQLKSRLKAAEKFAEFTAVSGFIFPPGLSVEQSSSSMTARYKAGLLGSGALCYDITGGFGVDSYYISEKFGKLIYCETSEELCELAAHNFPLLGADNIVVKNGDGLSLLERCNAVYCDPSRRKNGARVFMLDDLSPNIGLHYDDIMQKTDKLLLKLSPMLDITDTLHRLKNCFQVHVVALEGEVKELLFLCVKNYCGIAEVLAADIKKDGSFRSFSSKQKQRKIKQAACILKYIYDPSAALRKSALADYYAASLALEKISANTFLYTSDDYIPDFQGRRFEFIEELRVNGKDVAQKTQKANIVTRNFPLKAEALRKKLKIADGGDDYLFALCDAGNNFKLLLARKI